MMYGTQDKQQVNSGCENGKGRWWTDRRANDRMTVQKEGGAYEIRGKIAAAQKKQGWTQEELAAKIKVSRQALSKWESGTAIPDTDNVLQISKLFEVSTDYLLKDEFANEDDLPAVSIGSDHWIKIDRRVIYPVIGSVVVVISAVGFLVLGILSSVYPAVSIHYIDEKTIVKTGLIAFLETNHIGWLFILCILTLLAGILVAIYPKLRRFEKSMGK